MYTTLFTHIDVDELTVFFLQTLQRFIVRTAQTDVSTISVLQGDTAALLVVRSELHLDEFQRVADVFESVPNYSAPSGGFAPPVLAVQVATVAVAEPPATLPPVAAAVPRYVVVLVFSAELHVYMLTQRITFQQTTRKLWLFNLPATGEGSDIVLGVAGQYAI